MQNITVNPVELATHLAASRIDELYNNDKIDYPYVESDEDNDEPSTYTEEGQKTFDEWYDWYYHVVTGHKVVYERPKIKQEKPKYKFLKENHDEFSDGTYLELLIGKNYDKNKIKDLYEWTDDIGMDKMIIQYKDRYFLITERYDYYGNLSHDYHEIKLINP